MKRSILDLIRGSTKPVFASAENWITWEATSKAAHPFRFWVVETAFDEIVNFVSYPKRVYNSISAYYRNRFISRSNQLVANPIDIKPGDWCDLSERLLFCPFNALQDFVEVELAGFFAVPWNTNTKYKFVKGRCPQAGIDYLTNKTLEVWHEDDGVDQELVGTPTPWAKDAINILELYNWWVNTYRNRPDPNEVSGLTKELMNTTGNESIRSFFELMTQVSTPAYKEALAKSKEIEDSYDAEDQAMLIRLMNSRHTLWV